MKVEGAPTPLRPPSETRAQHVELERGELGTVVTEFTVATTTVTTHKIYRVEDA